MPRNVATRSAKPPGKRAAASGARDEAVPAVQALARDVTRRPPFAPLLLEDEQGELCTHEAVGLRLSTRTQARAFEQAAVGVFERLLSALPPGVWTSADIESRHDSKITPNVRSKIRAALEAGRWKNDEAFVQIAGDSSFEGEAFAEEAFELMLSRFSDTTDLRFRAPASYVWSVGAEPFFQLMLQIARDLPFESGVLAMMPLGKADKVLAARPHLHSGETSPGVTPGIAWAHFLGPETVASLGGVEALRSAVPDQVTVAPLDGGRALVRTMEAPTPTPSEDELDRLRALAKVLAPVTEFGTTNKRFAWDVAACARHELALLGFDAGLAWLERRAAERNTLRDRAWVVEVAMELGAFDRADAALTALRRDFPDVQPLSRGDNPLVAKLATAATRSGKHPEIANRWVDHFLEHRHVAPFALFPVPYAISLADLLVTLGRYDEACAEAAVVFTRYPNNSELPDRLARLAHSLGKADDAASWAHRVLSVVPPHEYDAALERYRDLSIL